MVQYISSTIEGTVDTTLLSRFIEYNDIIHFDFEATGLEVYTLKPLLLAIGNADNRFVIDCRTCPSIIKNLFIPGKLYIAHNAKYDLKILQAHFRVNIHNLIIWDTQIVSQCIYNGYDMSHTLDACLGRHFQITMNKQQRNTFIDKPDNSPFTKEDIIYAADDILHLGTLRDRQLVLIKKYNLEYLIELENKVVFVLTDMELFGIYLDIEQFIKFSLENAKKAKEYSEAFTNELITLNNKIFDEPIYEKPNEAKKRKLIAYQPSLFDDEVLTNSDIIRSRFKISSPNQVAEVLRRVGLTLSGTGKAVVEDYIRNNPTGKYVTLLNHLVDYRTYSKLASTYGENFRDKINPKTKRIHTDYGQCFTDTLRLSSSNPNLQNLPQTNSIRHCIKADKDYMILTCDLDGQENGLAASDSQDPILVSAINEGRDLHSYLAEPTYNIIYDELGVIPNHGAFKSSMLILDNGIIKVSKSINKALRNEHKSLLFAKYYKAGIARFSEVLNIPKNIAAKVFNRMEKSLPVLTEHQDKVAKGAVRRRYVINNNITKKRRWFEKDAEDYKIEKEACNFRIQASAADQVKEAMIRVLNEVILPLRINYPRTAILMQVHDDQ